MSTITSPSRGTREVSRRSKAGSTVAKSQRPLRWTQSASKRGLLLSLWASLSFLLTSPLLSQAQSGNRIPFAGQDPFLSGSNVAWVRFAYDVGPGTTDLATFNQMFSDVKAAGGNSMRLWLHTSGQNSPAWSGDRVIGPGTGTIEDIRAILDLAQSHDVALMLTLWSFDMVRASFGTAVVDRSYGILTNQDRRNEYIQNALIPMVEALKGHPAILAWEIFNEPEGMSREFGWTDIINSNRLVPMSDIQAFINQTTGAIKRTDPNVLVTNGAWAFYSNSDIFTGNANYRNYYRDDRLIAAGRDPDGVLDFYTVHYYSWGGTTISPFHHPASYWQLDKPIAMTEFYLQDTFGVSPSQMYENLYQNGYAGAMGWQWFGQGSNWTSMLSNMRTMASKYPEAVSLSLDGVVTPDPVTANLSASPSSISFGGSATLSWSSQNGVSATLNGEAVSLSGSRSVSLTETTTYTLRVTGSSGRIASASTTVQVAAPPAPVGENIAALKPATASSVEGGLAQFAADRAFDANTTTRWSSAYADGQTLTVDLQGVYRVNRVILLWEAAYASGYSIDVSLDGSTWTSVYSTSSGNGGTDDLILSSASEGRYIRMNGTQRATQWGMSLFEMQVFGDPVASAPLAADLSVSSSRIEIGASSTLSWTSQGAVSATLNGEPVEINGSRIVSPEISTGYSLIVRNASGQTLSREVTIEVVQLTGELRALPESIDLGLSSTLSWTTQGATNVTLDGISVPASGTRTVTPEQTTTYSLSAINGAGRRIDRTITVQVVPVTAELTADALILDAGQNTMLRWTVEGATSASLNGEPVALQGSQAISPQQSTSYTLLAVNSAGRTAQQSLTVTVNPVLPPDPVNVNVALGKPVTASSVESNLARFAASMAVDGNASSRWSSAYADGQLLTIDLQGEYLIDRFVMSWEAAYAAQYGMEVSLDGSTFTRVFTETSGNGGRDEITLSAPVRARYVRMNGIRRATQWGISLWEVEAYGIPAPTLANVALGKAVTTTSVEANLSRFAASMANDGNATTRWSSAYADGQLLTLDLGAEHTIERVAVSWEAAYAGQYAIEISQDGSTFTRVFTETAGNGGRDVISLDAPVKARFVRMNGIRRATQWGFSIWEFEVYGLPVEGQLTAMDGQLAKPSGEAAGDGTPAGADAKSASDETMSQSEDPMGSEEVTQTELLPNYPNPFNPTTTIAYRLAESTQVTLEVFDMSGRRVAIVDQGMRQVGVHQASFDGSSLASGTYLIRLRADQVLLTRMMTLMK